MYVNGDPVNGFDFTGLFQDDDYNGPSYLYANPVYVTNVYESFWDYAITGPYAGLFSGEQSVGAVLNGDGTVLGSVDGLLALASGGAAVAGAATVGLIGGADVGIASLGDLGTAATTSLADGGTTASTTLYRAVLDSELQSIQPTSTYTLTDGMGEVKGFYPTPSQTSNFAQQMYSSFPGDGAYTLTSTTAPVNSLPEAIYVLGEGTAYFLPSSSFPLGPLTIYPFMPIP